MISLSPDHPILVVDDSHADRLILDTVLQRSRLVNAVEAFSSGQELLERMDQAAQGTLPMPALILLDIDMPGMSGLDVLDKLRTQACFRSSPVVISMLTSFDSDTDRDRAQTLGADEYLVKPSGIDAFATLFDERFANEG